MIKHATDKMKDKAQVVRGEAKTKVGRATATAGWKPTVRLTASRAT